MTWVKNPRDETADSCAANALAAGYTQDEKSLCKESSTGLERLRPGVLWETQLQETQAGIQGLETYDDVPGDDMTPLG